MATRMVLPVSTISRQATSILRAWERRDVYRFQAALDGTLQASPGDSTGTLEAERTELLQRIAWEFHASPNPMRPAAGADAERIEVCLDLLRHLIISGSGLSAQAR